MHLTLTIEYMGTFLWSYSPAMGGNRCLFKLHIVRKVVLFIIITLIKIIKHTMEAVRNWIEERLLLIKQALQQPIVPNTPQDGVL